MPSINIVHLGGYCEGDPRLVGDEGSIVSFRIRCQELVRPRSKEPFVRTEHFTVKAFGKETEWVGLNATEGTPLLIQGKLRVERWGDGDDKKREVVIIADSLSRP